MKLTKIESYEIQAFAFLVMTGYRAHGKDSSPLADEAPYEERCAAWDEWRNKNAHCILAMLHGFEALIDRDDEPTGALLDRLRAAEAEVERLRCNAMQWRKPGPVTAEHPLDCLIVIPTLRQADGDWWIRGSEFLEGDAPIAWCADTSIARAALAQYGIVDRQEDAA